MEGQGREGEEKREGEEQRGKKGERESLIGGSDLGMFLENLPFSLPSSGCLRRPERREGKKCWLEKGKAIVSSLFFFGYFPSRNLTLKFARLNTNELLIKPYGDSSTIAPSPSF